MLYIIYYWYLIQHILFLAFNFNTHNWYMIHTYIHTYIHVYLVIDVVVCLPVYLRNLCFLKLFFRFNNETWVQLAWERISFFQAHLRSVFKTLPKIYDTAFLEKKKINNGFYLLTIFTQKSTIDICQGLKYPSATYQKPSRQLHIQS